MGQSTVTYAGDVTSLMAWEALNANPQTLLIDVRTKAEWHFVGLPDIRSTKKDLLCIEWQFFPNGSKNPDFQKEFENQVSRSNVSYFLCRSGSRSKLAAILMSKEGYDCYNIKDGFEGNSNETNQRSGINGWKFSKLPWFQS